MMSKIMSEMQGGDLTMAEIASRRNQKRSFSNDQEWLRETQTLTGLKHLH